MKSKKLPSTKKVSQHIKRVKKTQELISEVESINTAINSTIKIRDGVAIDLKNFSATSIPTNENLSFGSY